MGKDRENFTRGAESPLRSVPPRYFAAQEIALRHIVDSKKRFFFKGTPRFQSIAGRACRVPSVFPAAKPWILRTVDLHCTSRIRRWLDEDLHEISHWYHRTTAGRTTLLLLARNSFWNVEPLDARRTHAYYGISTTPIPRFSSKSKRANANANAKSSSLPSLDSLPNLPDVSIITRPPDPRVHRPQKLAFPLRKE